jgi:hypothetical protein
MNVAMLLNFHKMEVTEEDIATSICALSYKGAYKNEDENGKS